MKFKKLGIMAAGVILGNMIAERFVLKAGPDTTGFVPITDGLGLDEIARAATIVGATMALDAVLKGGR